MSDTHCQVMSQSADDSELNRLLAIIFKPDEDGIVHGDIAMELGSKVSPEVRQFIKDVLQQDMSSYRMPAIPDGMDDDFALSLSRNLGESKQDYAERVAEIIRYNTNEIRESQEQLQSKEDE